MNQYSFTVAWSDDDEGYIALCPEFPKLSGFGETVEDALVEVRTALKAAVQSYQDAGWPLPEPRKQQEYSGKLLLRLPRSLHARLAEAAEADEVSLNTYVVTLLSGASSAAAMRLVIEQAMRELDPTVKQHIERSWK